MFSMFVLWFVVFIGIARKWRFTPAIAIVTLVVTVVLLRYHMTSPIPLNF
jgi:hypothetical protein